YNNPDNEGHIVVGLVNHSGEPVEIKKGERIAQGIFKKYLLADGDDADKERLGGFGSTGK
ncbi:MAG TPA: dUTP diphosphatase, partial [Nitrospirae bacterium]|nr:dUTP diphosphatase [Nitrospirota bacterium]